MSLFCYTFSVSSYILDCVYKHVSQYIDPTGSHPGEAYDASGVGVLYRQFMLLKTRTRILIQEETNIQ